MSIDKIFGFFSDKEEDNIIQSLLEHTRIDEEELILLQKMFNCLPSHDHKIGSYLEKIETISIESKSIFEHTANQIIQSKFDQQKQYDLLRIYQRIDSVSHSILDTAKFIHIYFKLSKDLSDSAYDLMKQLVTHLLNNHTSLKEILSHYQHNKSEILPMIYALSSHKDEFDNLATQSIEQIYILGDQNLLKVGSFRALENIVFKFTRLSDTICDAATSFEWLLLN